MKTKEEVYGETYDVLLINNVKALFTCLRIDRSAVPEGLHAYDIRESDTDGDFATIEPRVIVNHAGTILVKTPFDFGTKGFVEITQCEFVDQSSLEEWINQ